MSLYQNNETPFSRKYEKSKEKKRIKNNDYQNEMIFTVIHMIWYSDMYGIYSGIVQNDDERM